jgi:hemerythrin-like metal-binding protein
MAGFEESVMGILWTEQMSVGNAVIDSDHKELIAMISGAEYMIKKRDSYALSLAFDHIEHWLRVHFSNEEMIAQTINYPFDKHKLEHENVLKTFCFMRDVINGKNGIWNEDAAELYSEFLSDWLTDHLINDDMLMKPMLQTYPYDAKLVFHPDLVQPEAERRGA